MFFLLFFRWSARETRASFTPILPLNICASDSSTLLYPEKIAKTPQVTCLILDISHLSEMLGDCRTNQGTEERMFVFHPFSFVRGGEDAAAKGSSGREGKGKINNCFSFGRWGIERRGIPKKKKEGVPSSEFATPPLSPLLLCTSKGEGALALYLQCAGDVNK